MKRNVVSALVVFHLVAFGFAAFGSAADSPRLISPLEAARHGLTRAWFLQSQVNNRRGQVQDLLLHEGTLFVQTNRGTLQAIDAETGQSLWATQVGSRDLLTLPPAANSRVVATVNGSIVYVLNRFTGEVLWMRQADGPIGAGCALSEDYVFVPTVQGRLYAYHLEPAPPRQLRVPPPPEELEEFERVNFRIEQKPQTPLAAQSVGRCLVQPVIARHGLGEDVVAWVTDRGFMFLGYINMGRTARLDLRHRIGVTPKTTYFDEQHRIGQPVGDASTIAARPTFLQGDPTNPAAPSLVFVASSSGVVFAIDERRGSVVWQFSTGERIDQRMAALEGRVYVPLQRGGMYCLDAASGRQIWFALNIERFVAASEHRVYAIDLQGRLVALNGASGARVGTILDARGYEHVYINQSTDRIYLATAGGLIQCLHEAELETPRRYTVDMAELRARQPQEAPARNGMPAAAPPAAPPAAAAPRGQAPANPFDANPFGASPFEPAADPFAPIGGANPFGDADPFDDPFGSSLPGDNPFL